MDEKDVLDENQILPEKDAEITIEAATATDSTETIPEKPKRKRAPRKKAQSDSSDASKPQDTDAESPAEPHTRS